MNKGYINLNDAETYLDTALGYAYRKEEQKMVMPGETILTGASTEGVSEFKVMCSAAGYYIGTSYFDEEIGCELPNTRESEYYATEEAANLALRTYTVKWR